MPSNLQRGQTGAIAGTLASITTAEPVEIYGGCNFIISGTFVATARLQVSFDAGATWLPVTLADGTVRQFTTPERIVIDEVEPGVLYRVECTARTSGTIAWRSSR